MENAIKLAKAKMRLICSLKTKMSFRLLQISYAPKIWFILLEIF